MLESGEREDTEVTLGTTALLGIFFGLVVVCGVFFGFGYSVGRHSTPPPVPGSPVADAAPVVDSSGVPKPSADQAARQTAAQTAAGTGDPTAADPASPASTGSSPAGSSGGVDTSTPSEDAGSKPALVKAAEQPVADPASKPAVLPVRPPAAALPSGPAMMVQIAAVSHQEDADVLVAALRKRGYSVSVRSEPQDTLMHVQVGPFSSRSDAVAMRQKLLADGYNAIIK